MPASVPFPHEWMTFKFAVGDVANVNVRVVMGDSSCLSESSIKITNPITNTQ